MNERVTNLACIILTVLFVAGMSAQAYGIGNSRAANEDCCCYTDPACDDTSPLEPDSGCCPEPGEDEECPCSCACSTCGVMTRTVNLYTVDAPFLPLSERDNPLRTPMADALPASTALGVDIQPPIA